MNIHIHGKNIQAKDRPKYVPGNYNISKRNGMLMLVCWVDLRNAVYYLNYYNTKYAAGQPCPNGKGSFPDAGFHIVWDGELDK